MKPIGVGFVFRATQRRGQTQPGLHRVIEVNGDPDDDSCLLVVIQIPEQPPPRQFGKKQASYYSRGFKRIRLEAVRQLLKENVANEALAPPAPPGGASPIQTFCMSAQKIGGFVRATRGSHLKSISEKQNGHGSNRLSHGTKVRRFRASPIWMLSSQLAQLS